MTAPLSGIDSLRRAVNLFANCRESFNEQYTPAELLMLHAAFTRSEWDILPDDWTHCEIREALAGTGAGAKQESRQCECSVCAPSGWAVYVEGAGGERQRLYGGELFATEDEALTALEHGDETSPRDEAFTYGVEEVTS